MNKTPSTLVEQTREILTRLASGGWDKVFQQHGLNIGASDLSVELLRPLEGINRNSPGFEDFASNGIRGIEPGKPALSLLFHGFSSPHVTSFIDSDSCVELSEYPSPGDLEVLENLVYGLQPFSLEDIRAKADHSHLAIVVYAKEYRVASNTVHQKHADMCYSRTGVARVGTSDSSYLPQARGYMPEDKTDERKVRVLPCRYAAYIAVLVEGDKAAHGPMRFITSAPEYGEENTERNLDKSAGATPTDDNSPMQTGDRGDASRRFWIPLHKLFSGNECLLDYDLDVQLTANHVNEKLRRVHLMFGRLGHDGGWHEPDLSKPPFRFTERIAGFSKSDEDGPGLLVPEVHDSLVAIATYKKPDEEKEEVLTYNVPNDEDVGTGMFSSSLYLPSSSGGARFAPEYVHARFAVDYDGCEEKDLNDLENVADIVRRGGYKAKHVLDFTGDGWIDVSCPSLNLEIPTRLAAYSLVAPPDYFVKVKQSGLMQWWEQSSPPSIQQTIWPQNPGLPLSLSDQRIAANIELNEAGFIGQDDTMTAIVGQLNVNGGQGSRIIPPRFFRHSMLTDGASGVFAPGWDVSFDQAIESTSDGESVVNFFSTHGLGSPFPEDAKLCAALSSYWPAAAPDITRTFQPSRRYATATPLLDSTIGQGTSIPWDGIHGPKIIDETKKIIEYTNLDYGDYVRASLNNEFLANVIGEIDQKKYIARTVAMARVYQALGATETADKVKYAVYSFTIADFINDQDLREALEKTHSSLSPDYAYRFAIFEPKPVTDETNKPFNKVWVGYDEIKILYADSMTVLEKNNKGEWTATRFRD